MYDWIDLRAHTKAMVNNFEVKFKSITKIFVKNMNKRVRANKQILYIKRK